MSAPREIGTAKLWYHESASRELFVNLGARTALDGAGHAVAPTMGLDWRQQIAGYARHHIKKQGRRNDQGIRKCFPANDWRGKSTLEDAVNFLNEWLHTNHYATIVPVPNPPMHGKVPEVDWTVAWATFYNEHLVPLKKKSGVVTLAAPAVVPAAVAIAMSAQTNENLGVITDAGVGDAASAATTAVGGGHSSVEGWDLNELINVINDDSNDLEEAQGQLPTDEIELQLKLELDEVQEMLKAGLPELIDLQDETLEIVDSLDELLSGQAWEALPTDERGGGEGSMLLRSIKDVINRFAQITCV